VITTAILWLLAQPLGLLAAVLPEWDPVDLSGYGAWLVEHSPFSWFGWLNHYFPVADVLAILAVLLTVGLALHAWGWVVWLGTKLHIFGGTGE
jgi:hypothetical protein